MCKIINNKPDKNRYDKENDKLSDRILIFWVQRKPKTGTFQKTALTDNELVSEWFFFNAKSAIFQHCKNKLHFDEMMMMSASYETSILSWIFIVVAHWNNSPLVDMSFHSDKLSYF